MRPPIPDNKLYELVEGIYAAASKPALWQSLVSRVAEAFPGTGAALIVRRSGDDGGILIVHANFKEGATEEFLRNHVTNSPWIGILRNVEPCVAFASEDHVPLATIKHSALYKKFCKPYDIGNCFCVRFKDDLDGRAMFVIACPAADTAALHPKVMPVLSRLAPHFQRALELSWSLRRQRSRGLKDGLARQADPVFVLNRHREVVFTNAAARGAADKGGIQINAATGQFKLAGRGDMAKFETLFASCEVPDNRAASSRHLLTFTLTGQRGPSVLELLVLPPTTTDADHIFYDARTEPYCLVTLRFRNALRTPSVADIRKVLSLSPMEADAALALAEGRSVEQHAKIRGVSVETVRWHLKNAYQRTDCAGQAELLRLVLSLVGPPRLS